MKTDKSWRTMLIKDSDGDYGILKAKWDGVRPGIPGDSNSEREIAKLE